jgi:hypothetical protein
VERDYSGPGIALQAGYRVRPGATLLARVAWTHSREVNLDDFNDFTWDERLDRFSLDAAVRGHASDHLWFEAAAGPVLAHQRWSRSDRAYSGTDTAFWLGTSAAIGIEILPSRAISPHFEGRIGAQFAEERSTFDASVGFGLSWH